MIEKISFMQDAIKNIYYQLPFLLDVSTSFNDTVDAMEKFVTVLGAGIGFFGLVNLGEGMFDNNPASKSTGIKFCIAGGFIFYIGKKLIPKLSNSFSVES